MTQITRPDRRKEKEYSVYFTTTDAQMDFNATMDLKELSRLLAFMATPQGSRSAFYSLYEDGDYMNFNIVSRVRYEKA